MGTIFDYVSSRGEFSFDEFPFNQVDAVAFSELSYVRLDRVVDTGTLSAISEYPFSLAQVRVKNDILLLSAMGKSLRYRNLQVRDYVSVFDTAAQFCALTLHDEKRMYVIYRGTDNTIEGWKEDFDMSFAETVPAQRLSLAYLEDVAGKYPGKEIIVMGHSKGGNLAVYSLLNADDALRERISAVYNNDGPGFNEMMNLSASLARYEGKIHTYVPESSVVGMLLEHVENYRVVKSTSIGIFQHSIYSWVLDGDDFIYIDDRDQRSYFVDTVLHDWLKSISPEERKQFVNLFYIAMERGGYENFDEVLKFFFLDIRNLVGVYSDMDDGERSLFKKVVGQLLQAQNKVIREHLGQIVLRLKDIKH
jgi:Protein of unknown function (DUF2974).